MELKLHHINLISEDVGRLTSFYREVLGMAEKTEDLPVRDKTRGYGGDVGFVTDGNIQMHLAEKDIHAGFRSGQFVNPVAHGHIAFRTDDLDGFIARLEARGIPYSEWGDRAVIGWRQVFFYDPEGNVVEVHQVTGEESP